MSVEMENLNKRIQILTQENNRLYSKLKTQQRKNTRLRSVLRNNGVRHSMLDAEYDKNISTRELVVDEINENENVSTVVQEVIVDSTEGSEGEVEGNISDSWEDTSMEFSGN